MSDNDTGFRKYGRGDGQITGVEKTASDDAIVKEAASSEWTEADAKGLDEELGQDS